jgi:hypothetical protein
LSLTAVLETSPEVVFALLASRADGVRTRLASCAAAAICANARRLMDVVNAGPPAAARLDQDPAESAAP